MKWGLNAEDKYSKWDWNEKNVEASDKERKPLLPLDHKTGRRYNFIFHFV